eukprot:8388550-Alexandrium_andersonii.AAC.1
MPSAKNKTKTGAITKKPAAAAATSADFGRGTIDGQDDTRLVMRKRISEGIWALYMVANSKTTQIAQ